MRSPGLLLALAALAACDGANGTQLGTYSVTATLTQNTCGSQVEDYLPTATFNVVLALSSGVLSWTPAGASAATGDYDRTAHSFALSRTTTTQVVAPSATSQTPGCTVDRVDAVQGTLAWTGAGDAGASQAADHDAGATAMSFTAIETIAYGARPGNDCRTIIGVQPGQVLALPCSVTYRMVATRTGP